MSILEIPEQVWFLAAFGALMVLLADTAVRSWHSPERVADPAFMWPRPAPARSDVPIGPRLPSGSFRMPEAGLRLGWGPGGSFFEDTAVYPVPRPLVVVPPAGSAFWSAPESVSKHEGATEGWSPLQEAEAVERTALPGDDTEGWWAERLRQFEHRLSVIDSAERTADGRRIEVVRGYGRTVDDELQAFVDGSQQLHAYRLLRIGDTGEMTRADVRRALARV
jgi:hypothetical protein